MMRSGWNPLRRNRNIGTAKSGHGLANRLVIPECRRDRRKFWEKLHDPVRIDFDSLTILVEPCLPGFVHAVTVDDTVRMFGLLPPDDVAGIRTIVLRQPTRKQRTLERVWGRLLYCADFAQISGPAIVLEAHPPAECIERPRSLPPDEADEIERLRVDGHRISCERRWRIQTSMASTRSTQLFRTLPHEVGHHVHYKREVEMAAGDDFVAKFDHYFSKPEREREDFAHRYAREIVEQLSAADRVPFSRYADDGKLKQWGLDPRWFGIT